MNFWRRLFGSTPVENTGGPKEEKRTTGTPPEITAPGVMVEKPPVELSVKPPAKRSTQDVNEAAITDPTPIMFGVTRQLPPLETYASQPGKHVTFGVNSDIGMIRNNNQDSMYVFFGTSVSAEGQPDFGLFIVADGMGGHHDGERASAIASRVVAQHVIENFYLPMMKAPNSESDRPIVSEVLSQAMQKANEGVAGEVPEGGTTVTAAAILGDLLYIAHVGDSRAYLITNEGIEQVTRDHSLVQRLIELDQLTQEEAALHPQRNVLYRAIGQSAEVEVDAVTRRLSPGARLLLCSDGLWNQVEPDNLKQIVITSKNPQDACDHLVRVANERGGPDNITVILIQVPG